MEIALSYLLTALFVLSILHFVYESIIVPSQRMAIRDELFQIRDQLRNNYSEYNSDDRKAFDILHNRGINHCLNNLSLYTLLTQIKIYIALERNQELKEELESQVKTVKNASHSMIHDSFNKYSKLVEKAHMLNSGGWFFYLIPIALFAVFAQQIKSFVVNSSFLANNRKNYTAVHI